MPVSLSDRQKAYRQRRNAKLAAMEAALEQIIARLDGNEKPLAVEIRQIASQGLL